MQPTLKQLSRRAPRRGDGDSGIVIIVVALLLVVFLIITAIVVDLGNARQQKREAVAAADAGALAGAQALSQAATMPTACAGVPDLSCLTAYHTLSSANLIPTAAAMSARSSTCTLELPPTADPCYQYVFGSATVDVKYPYTYSTFSNTSLIHTRICWDSPTAFARVIGRSSVNVCGAATAQWTGNQPPQGGGGPVPDCSVEDNFEDPGENGMIYVFDSGGGAGKFNDENKVITFANGHKVPQQHKDLAVVFDGHGTGVNLSSIVFKAPVQLPSGVVGDGSVVTLPRLDPPASTTKGPESTGAPGSHYVVQTLTSPVYQVGGANDGMLLSATVVPYVANSSLVIISYELPDDKSLGGGGSTLVYSASLHVTDSEDTTVPPAAPTRCGNANWSFNHNGSIPAAGGSTCGENSFFAFQPTPASNQIIAGQTILQAYYVDESKIQDTDYAAWPGTTGFPATPNFGIDFTYTLNGVTTRIPQNVPSGSDPTATGPPNYWLTTSIPPYVKDKFYTTINWRVPSSFLNGTYTIFLKAYDTDNNKAGNDCGIFKWDVTVTGGNGGSINLVE